MDIQTKRIVQWIRVSNHHELAFVEAENLHFLVRFPRIESNDLNKTSDCP